MTKTGKSSAYWSDICHRYAQGNFQFSTRQKAWKQKMEGGPKADWCPAACKGGIRWTCLTGEKCALVVSIRVVYYIIYQKLDKSLYHVIDYFMDHLFSECTVLQNNWWKYLTWIERPSFVANLLFSPVNRLRHGLWLSRWQLRGGRDITGRTGGEVFSV